MALSISHSDTLDPSKMKSKNERMKEIILGIDPSQFSFINDQDQQGDELSYAQKMAQQNQQANTPQGKWQQDDTYQARVESSPESKQQTPQTQEVQAEATKTSDTGQSDKNYLRTLYEDYMGIAAPQRDTEREGRLRRAGKVQHYTNALSTIAQAVGAFAGADIPKIQYRNEPAGELKKLQDAFDDDQKRAQMTALNAAIQGLGAKQGRDFQAEQGAEQREYYSTENAKNRQQQKELSDQQFEQSKQLDTHRTSENVRQYKETNDFVPAVQHNLTGQKNKADGRFYPDQHQPVQDNNNSSGDKDTDKDKIVLYSDSSKASTKIDKYQAYNVLSRLLKGADRDETGQLTDEKLRTIEAALLENKEVSDDLLGTVLQENWNKYPWLQQGVTGWPLHDYLAQNWNPQDQKLYQSFAQTAKSEQQIKDYLLKYDPKMGEGMASEIARQQMKLTQSLPSFQRESGQQQGQAGEQEDDHVKVDNWMQDASNQMYIENAARKAMEKYPDDPEKQRRAIRSVLQSRGLTDSQIDLMMKK